MAEASTVDKLRDGPPRQHRPFLRRRCHDQGWAARRRIWCLWLASRLEHIHYVLAVDDALADGRIRRPREYGYIPGRIPFSSCGRLDFSEVIWIAERPRRVFRD